MSKNLGELQTVDLVAKNPRRVFSLNIDVCDVDGPRLHGNVEMKGVKVNFDLLAANLFPDADWSGRYTNARLRGRNGREAG